MKKLFLPLFLLLTLFSCDRNNNVNLIDPAEDVVLGRQLAEEVMRNPEQFPVLDPEAYPKSYAYLQNMVNTILESGEVVYRDDFAWKVHIIKDDSTLNAFATPGGYIYVYTGLIKYLDTEGDLAGVIGHEIAHADLRHSSRQLQKAYGLNMVLSLFVGEGERSMLKEVLAGLAGQFAGLKFSRDYEKEADARSVDYLANTPYPCNAAANFFRKLEQEEKVGRTPAFFSTHPHPENRVKEIDRRSQRVGCDTSPSTDGSYQAFQRSLP